MSQNIGMRIKQIRLLLKLSRSDFEPNISSATLRHWETGSYLPKDKNFLLLVDTFKKHGAIVSTQWLKTGKGQPPKVEGISIPSDLYFNTSLYVENQKETHEQERNIVEKDEILFRDINHIKKLYRDEDSMLVCTSEMSPQFKVGDYVFGIKIDYKKYKNIDLEPAIVTLKNGKKFLCYFSYNKENDKTSFIYEHGLIDFRKVDVLNIAIVVVHRRSVHFSVSHV